MFHCLYALGIGFFSFALCCASQPLVQDFALKKYVVQEIEHQVQMLAHILRKPYDSARIRLLSDKTIDESKKQTVMRAYQELAAIRVHLYKTELYEQIIDYLLQLNRTPFEHIQVMNDFLTNAHQLSKELNALQGKNFYSQDFLVESQTKARYAVATALAEKTSATLLAFADKEYSALAASEAALNKERNRFIKESFEIFITRLADRVSYSNQKVWQTIFEKAQEHALMLSKQWALERMLETRLSLVADYSGLLRQVRDNEMCSDQQCAASKVGRDMIDKDRLQKELDYLHEQAASELSGYAPLVDVIGAFNTFGITELFFYFLPEVFAKPVIKPLMPEVEPQEVSQASLVQPVEKPETDEQKIAKALQSGEPTLYAVEKIIELFNTNGWRHRNDLISTVVHAFMNHNEYKFFHQGGRPRALTAFDVVALFNRPEFTNWLITDFIPNVSLARPVSEPAVSYQSDLKRWMLTTIMVLCGPPHAPTVLDFTLRQNYPSLLSAIFASKVITPDSIDFTRDTLLGYALEQKSVPVVKLLLEGGANPRRKVFDVPGAGPTQSWETMPRDLAKDNPELLSLIDQYLNKSQTPQPQPPVQESVPSELPAPTGPQYAGAVDYIDNNFLKRPYSPEEQAGALFHTWYEISTYRQKPLFQYTLQQFVKRYRKEPGYKGLTELGVIALMNNPRPMQLYLQYNLDSKKNEIIADVKQTIATLALPAQDTPDFASILRERYPQALAVVFKSIPVDDINYTNQTLLGYALEHKSVPVVQLLLEGGADSNRHVYPRSLMGDYLPNDNYPLDLAKGNAELTELLKQYGATKQH